MYLREVRLLSLPKHHQSLPSPMDKLGPYHPFFPDEIPEDYFRFIDNVVKRRKHGPHDVPREVEEQWMCVPLDIADEYAALLKARKVNVAAEILEESKEPALKRRESVLMCLIHTLAESKVLSRGDTLNDIFIRYLQSLAKEDRHEWELEVPMVLMFLQHLPDTPNTKKKLEAITLLHDMAHQTPRSSAFFKAHRQACNQLPRLKNVEGFEELRSKISDLDDPHMKRVLAAVDSSASGDNTGPIDRCIGEIRLFAGGKLPKGWEYCNGQEFQIRNYAALYSVLRNLYGGDGRTTFCLPDLRGRIPMGSSSAAKTVAKGGTTSLQLTLQNMPSHAHEIEPALASGVRVPDAFNIGVTSQKANSATAGAGEGMLADLSSASPAKTVRGYLPPTVTVIRRNLGGIDFENEAHLVQKLAITTSAVGVSETMRVSTLPPFLALNYAIAVEGIYPMFQK